ncbi:hypothetical protein, partial [Pseudomonas viridiflava]
MLKLAALPLLVLPLFALADCKDQLDDWARTVKPDLKFDRERAACKINPADGSQTLVALPFAENVTEDGDGDY